jgi:hypothetical protein
MRQVLHMEIPPPKTVRFDVPVWLDEICLRALQRPPFQRYTSAEQMAAVLEDKGQKNKVWATRSEISEWIRKALAAPLKRPEQTSGGAVPTMVSLSFPATESGSGPRERFPGLGASVADTGGGPADTIASPAPEDRASRKKIGLLVALLLLGGVAAWAMWRPAPAPTVLVPSPATPALAVEPPPSPSPAVAAIVPPAVEVPAEVPAALASEHPPTAVAPALSVPGAPVAPGASPSNDKAGAKPVALPHPRSPRPPPATTTPAAARSAVAPAPTPATADTPNKPLPSLESNPYLRRGH